MFVRAHVILQQQGPFVRFWRLLHLAATASYRDNCFGIAKGAAYSGLLSFFPMLTTFAAVLVQVNADQVASTLAGFLYEVIPPGTEEVVNHLFVVKGTRPVLLLISAIVVAAWAASGAVISMMDGFRVIYNIPTGRGFLRDRGMALLLVFVAVLPVWAASALIVIGTRTTVQVLGLLPPRGELSDMLNLVAQLLRYLVAFTAFVLVSALVYYLAPNRRHTFVSVLPGAALATLLWMLATAAFAWWVRHVAQYNVLYGSVGAGLALLVWIYVLALVMLYGAEFNAVQERSQRFDVD